MWKSYIYMNFKLRPKDREWLQKFNNKLWEHRYKKTYVVNHRLDVKDWHALLFLIDKYDLPCTIVKDSFHRHKFKVLNHIEYPGIRPDTLIRLVQYHFLNWADYKNSEKKIMMQSIRPLIRQSRNEELLKIYDLERPKDRIFSDY